MTNHEPVYKDFVCGGVAAVMNMCILFPFYKTIFFQQLDNISWTDSVRRMVKEGPRNIYRGLLPPLMQHAMARSVMFGSYGNTLVYLEHLNLAKFTQAKITISAVSAGILEAVLMPFERVQTLLQNKKYYSRFKNTYHAFSTLKMDYGGKELYRGFTTVLLRNSAANCLYFSICERFIYDRNLSDDNRHRFSYHLFNFSIGGFLGASIGLLIYPLNVIKTRQQSFLGDRYYGLLETLRSIYLSRGRSVTLIYRGAPANCVRSVLAWGLLTSLNEWLQNTAFSKMLPFTHLSSVDDHRIK